MGMCVVAALLDNHAMVACTVKTFVGYIRELGSVLCFLPIFSTSFTSLVLPSAILMFCRTLHWDVVLSSAFRAVG